MKTLFTILAISITFSGWAGFTPKSIEGNNLSFTEFQQDNYSYSKYPKKRKKSHRKGHSRSHGKGSSFGVAPVLSMLKPISLNTTYGLGVKGYYSLGGRLVVNLGFDYYLPISSTFETLADAIPVYVEGPWGSYMVHPAGTSIPVSKTTSIMQVKVGALFYFAGRFSEEGFKFFGEAGAGLMDFKTSTTLGNYDHQKYTTTYKEGSKSSAGAVIYLGLGVEQSIGKNGGLFCDFKLNLPATESNGRAIEVKIPVSIQASLGYKIMF